MNKSINAILKKFNSTKRNDLFSESVINLSLQILGLALSYIAVYLISHVYDADVLGYYTLSNVVLQIASMIVLFGINTATVQMVPGFFAARNNNSVSSLILKGALHTIIVGLIVSLIVYFSADFIATHILHKPQLAVAYRQVSFAIMPLSLLTLLADFLRGCGKNTLWAVMTRVFSSLFFIIIFLGIYYIAKNPDPVLLNVLSYIISAAIALFIFVWFVKKQNISLNLAKLEYNPTYKSLRKISFPMFLFSSNILIGGWISTLMVGMYGTTADTGVFRVVDRIGALCTLVLIAVNAVLAPKIAAAFAKKDFESLKKNVKFATKLTFWLSIPIQIGLIVLNKFVLGVFGHEFLSGSTALMIVLIGYIVNSLTGPVGQVLNMTHHQVYLRNVSFISLILTIILNYFLIPVYGIAGAAFASMFNNIFINIVCVIKIRKEFSFNSFYIPFIKF